jgi:hypothetical protein
MQGYSSLQADEIIAGKLFLGNKNLAMNLPAL